MRGSARPFSRLQSTQNPSPSGEGRSKRVSKLPRGLEKVPADECAAEGEEGLMDTRIAFIADRETAIAMQPGERAFDDPAGRTEPAAMRRAPTREEGDDAAGPQPVAMGLRIVAAIPWQRVRPAERPTAPSPDRRQRRPERIELRNVVDVRGGQLRDERDPVGFRDEVVLGTRLAAIGWVRSSFFPRAARGVTRYRRPPTADPTARGDATPRAAPRASVATRPRAATGRAAASRCCPSRSPFLSATSARAAPRATPRGCRSARPGRGPGAARRPVRYGVGVWAGGARSASTGDHRSAGGTADRTKRSDPVQEPGQ
jgi:hypothetical protein